QMDEIRALAEETGVDGVRFKTAQIYDYETDPHQLIPQDKAYSRYRPGASGKMEPRHALYNHCWRLWQGAVITWDGLVVPCCFDKDALHRMGDLKTASFREIWRAPAYRQFRRAVLNSRKNIDICANC